MNKIRSSRTDTFEHTISGLLTKRMDLFHEAERIRDRLAEIRNDIDALDRTLNVLGYDGDLDAAMPRQKRHVIFGRGELTRQVLTILRRSGKPLTSRQIAQEIVSDSGMDEGTGSLSATSLSAWARLAGSTRTGPCARRTMRTGMWYGVFRPPMRDRATFCPNRSK
jgi:hypothetical protein